jgi:hypothetical protein
MMAHTWEIVMTALHSFLVTTHIVFGAAALLLFWIPVLARKGSRLHVRAGKAYTVAMYIVSVTAFTASVIVLVDPLGIRRPGEVLDPAAAARAAQGFRMGSLFLLMLSVLVFSSIHHGLLALRERTVAGILKTPWHRGLLISLGLLGLGVGIIGFRNEALLLMIFGGISVSASIGMFRETLPERLDNRQRVIAHLGGLIGSGIGAYTAFFAFGGARFLAELLPGQWQVVSWIIAPVIGTIAINRLSRRYRGTRGRTDFSHSLR